MKKTIASFFAIIIIFFHVTSACAWAFLPVLASFGTGSSWVLGGARVMSLLLRVVPTAGSGSGIVPASRLAWVALTKNAGQVASFGAKLIVASGAAAGAGYLAANWDQFASSVAAQWGWVKIDGVWMKVVARSGYVFVDMRAYNYWPQYLIDYGQTYYSPPHIVNIEGIWETSAQAQAACDLKRTQVLGDTSYHTVSLRNQNDINMIAYATPLPAAAVRVHYFRAYAIADAKFQSWHYFAPVPNGQNGLVAPGEETVPLSNSDIIAALQQALDSNKVEAKSLIEGAENLSNELIKTDAAIREWLTDWALDGAPADLVDGVAADGQVDSQTDSPALPVHRVGYFKSLVINRFAQFNQSVMAGSFGSIYNGMFGNIPTSSTCTMQVNMGQTFGGVQTYSFCEWASWFSVVASVLMIAAGYAAIRIIFRGGGG